MAKISNKSKIDNKSISLRCFSSPQGERILQTVSPLQLKFLEYNYVFQQVFQLLVFIFLQMWKNINKVLYFAVLFFLDYIFLYFLVLQRYIEMYFIITDP